MKETPTEGQQVKLADCTDEQLKAIGYDHFHQIQVKGAVVAKMQEEIKTHKDAIAVVNGELARRAQAAPAAPAKPAAEPAPQVAKPTEGKPAAKKKAASPNGRAASRRG